MVFNQHFVRMVTTRKKVFFLFYFALANKLLLFNNLNRIHSLIYKIIPPPQEDRYKRIGFLKPGIEN